MLKNIQHIKNDNITNTVDNLVYTIVAEYIKTHKENARHEEKGEKIISNIIIDS